MLIKKIARLHAIMPVFLFVMLAFPFVMQAQVTTSSMSGTVKTSKGEALVGATVTATHVPTGTVYRVTTRSGGLFNIYNMAPGGPYSVAITFV
ncbi:MAG TPA: carboxypeptidase-like regulatory domain-containing protein, partial [Chitinophagaceae bacterium]|nr:carboxypeptidase-like regulatory domain-containing protein [Chitinophagaceae bacterium]